MAPRPNEAVVPDVGSRLMRRRPVVNRYDAPDGRVIRWRVESGVARTVAIINPREGSDPCP